MDRCGGKLQAVDGPNHKDDEFVMAPHYCQSIDWNLRQSADGKLFPWEQPSNKKEMSSRPEKAAIPPFATASLRARGQRALRQSARTCPARHSGAQWLLSAAARHNIHRPVI
jgi:hypothetical protein